MEEPRIDPARRREAGPHPRRAAIAHPVRSLEEPVPVAVFEILRQPIFLEVIAPDPAGPRRRALRDGATGRAHRDQDGGVLALAREDDLRRARGERGHDTLGGDARHRRLEARAGDEPPRQDPPVVIACIGEELRGLADTQLGGGGHDRDGGHRRGGMDGLSRSTGAEEQRGSEDAVAQHGSQILHHQL